MWAQWWSERESKELTWLLWEVMGELEKGLISYTEDCGMNAVFGSLGWSDPILNKPFHR